MQGMGKKKKQPSETAQQKQENCSVDLYDRALSAHLIIYLESLEVSHVSAEQNERTLTGWWYTYPSEK